MNNVSGPEFWIRVPIGDTCSPVEKFDPGKDGEDSFRYIDISSIDSQQKTIVDVREIRRTDAPSRARQRVRFGDVIVSTVRPNLNTVATVPQDLDEAICSTGFCVLRAQAQLINPEYLFYWTRHPEFVQRLTRLARGIGYPAVSDNDVYSVSIPLPPLPEQQRIVAILRQADDLRRQQQAALAEAQKLIPAIFHEMFGEDIAQQGELVILVQ